MPTLRERHLSRRMRRRTAPKSGSVPTTPIELPSRQPRFEALSVVIAAPPASTPIDALRPVLTRAKLGRWKVDPVPGRRNEFELLPPSERLRPSPGESWDLTYALRDQPEVVHAEPLFEYSIADQHPQRRARRASSVGTSDDPATDDNFEWSLERANVIGAWGLFNARVPGAGVIVGHPDTGYTPHPELADAARLLIDQGYDFDDDDPDPIDDLDDGFLDNPGHGTGTASVIASDRGAAPGNSGRSFVSGVAFGASLIPIRTTESVVLFSMRGLRQAIDHARARGAHVVSISLGGPWPSSALRRAIADAVDAGVIVLAAAGNQVRVVVFPAAFEETIAVAATTIKDVPWSGSSRGDAVDISAPGASVWRAYVERAATRGFAFDVTRGSGTSFAVATTAGIAALWVSFHGWTTLVRKYGAENVARVFRSLLQGTCRTPPGWDTGNYGPGIVDAERLLRTPLPAMPPARKLRDARRPAVAMDHTGIETIVHLLPDASRTDVEATIASMLGIDDRALPQAMQDVGDELAFQLVMNPALLEHVQNRARRRALAPRGARAPVAVMPGRGMMSTRLRASLRRGATPRRKPSR